MVNHSNHAGQAYGLEEPSSSVDIKELTVAPMDVKHAEAICGWRYEAPYHVFNWPSWANLKANSCDFGDPELREHQFAVIVNAQGALIGFVQFFPLQGVTRLGLGLHPQLCSKGIGTSVVRLIADEARRRAPGDEIDMEVLTWNTRAIRTYEKAGFRITDTYYRQTPAGDSEFHCMVREN